MTNAGGTLVLINTNNYSGPTTITGGTLQLGNGPIGGSVPGNIADSGVLAFDNIAAQTYGGAISGAGSLTKIGSGGVESHRREHL